MAYSIDRMPERISIGRETETGVTDVMIDCSAWVRKWPGMTLHAIHTPEGGAPYILQTETDGGVLVWHVTDADTATPGTGSMEIVGEMDGRRKVSATVKVSVAARMSGTVGEPPEAAQPWVDSVLEAAGRITGMQAQAKTLDAGSGATAEWDGEQGLLTIGVPKGEKGEKGDTGEQGPNGVQGPQGEKGADGKDAVVDATLTKSGQAADAKAAGDALAGKLTEPSTGLEVGKYFRIAAIDDSGHAVLEAVNLPIAADKQAGMVQVSNYDGWYMYGNRLQAQTIESANYAGMNNTAIIGKGTLNSILSTPSVMPPLTAEEQAAARKRMGLPGDYELIEEIICDGTASAYTREVDPSGIPYDLESVYIEIEIQAENARPHIYVRAYDESKKCVLYDGISAASKQYVSYLCYGCYADRGMYHGWAIGTNIANSNSGGSYSVKLNMPLYVVSPIKKVFVNIGSGTFFDGDKIRIYGVRA